MELRLGFPLAPFLSICVSSRKSPDLSEPQFLHVRSREQIPSPLTCQDLRISARPCCSLGLGRGALFVEGKGCLGCAMVLLRWRSAHIFFLGGCSCAPGPLPAASVPLYLSQGGGETRGQDCPWAEPTHWHAARLHHLPVRKWSAGVGFGAQVIANG